MTRPPNRRSHAARAARGRVQATITLSPIAKGALEMLARRDGVTMSALVERLVMDEMEHNRKWPT